MREEHHNRRVAGGGTFGRLAVVLVGGLVVVAIVFWQTRRAQLAGFRLEFESAAASRTALIRQETDKSLLAIKSLGWFVDSTGTADGKTFKAFATACLPERKELQALSWDPRVPVAERAGFEQSAPEEGRAQLRITEHNANGRLVPAQKRGVYYPVLYIEPRRSNEAAVGFDVGSDAVRLAALERARDTGEPAVTEPIQLVQQEGQEAGFLIFVAVYQQGSRPETVQERRAALKGFAVGVYNAGTVVSAALGGVEPMGISLTFLDRSAPPDRQLMGRWDGLFTAGRSWKSLLFPAPPTSIRTFAFAGRQWSVEALAGPAYMERHCPISYWLVLPAGLFVGLLATLYVWALLSSRERMEQLVTKRTAQLCQTQEMLRTVLDAIPVRVLWKDRDSVYLGCNRRFAKDAGLSSGEEIAGKTDFDLPWKQNAEFLRGLDRRVIESGQPMLDFEQSRTTSDGRVLTLRQSKLPLRDANGGIIGVLSIYQDITERKQAEETLRQSREQLRQRAEELETIMDSAPVALWVAHDPLCNRVSGNRMAGRFDEAGPQANWSANVSGAVRWFRDGRQLQPEELPMQQAVLKNAEIHNTELELLLQTGQRVSLFGSAMPLRDAQGRVRGCVGAFLDNTDRKRAEFLLAGEKRVLEWIANRKPLPEVLTEICRFIEEIAPGMMSSILLLDADGKRLRPVAAPKLPKDWTLAITPLAIGPEVGSCGAAAWAKEQVVVSDIATDPRWTEFTDFCALALKCGLRACWSTPILSADGGLLGTFAMYYQEPRSPLATDLDLIKQVTHLASIAIEHDRAAEGVRRAHNEMEQRVRERTAELVRANERLEELDRLKSQFLATMSHELRTPLNSIIGFTGILRQGFAGPVNEEQKKQLNLAFSSGKHLLSLINDLLDLSRIEAGKVEIEREPFDFVEVIEDVVQNLTPMAAQKNLRLATDLPGSAIPMEGDRKRSYQILLNLANNAVKFTDRGEVKISARVEGGQLRVCVADTGIGIKPEQMGMLFEAFRQLDGTAKRVYEGTGLGLHLCRKLLRLMHGEIGVESEFGKGSRFSFTLPRQLNGEPISQERGYEDLNRG
jgi:PAS domain S-box-containing protein